MHNILNWQDAVLNKNWISSLWIMFQLATTDKFLYRALISRNQYLSRCLLRNLSSLFVRKMVTTTTICIISFKGVSLINFSNSCLWIKFPTFCRWYFRIHSVVRKFCVLIKMSLKSISKVPLDNNSSLVEAWWWQTITNISSLWLLMSH